jgi:group II intron reverse transcriptase/maturase
MMRNPFGGDRRATVVVAAARLTVLNGSEAGRSIMLPPLPCRLGRGGDSEIVLRDPDDPPALSREHATLAWRGDDLLVTDQSVNGTRVGQRLLTHGETAALVAGETLGLGPTLRLEWSGRSAPGLPVTSARSPQPGTPQPTPHVGDLRAYLTAPATLQAAWRRVELNRGGAGPDNVTIAEFGRDSERRLAALREELRRSRYELLPPRLYAVPKRAGGVRAIAILRVQDRIVHQALHMALSPLLEPGFPACSYAYRPGVSAHDALRAVDARLREGFVWVAETDITAFFDHIAHRVLLDKLTAQVADPFLLSLVARCLAAGATLPGVGLPQGAATSPLLSNLYLAEFDAQMLAGGWNPVRYGDDLLFACRDRAGAQAALSEAEGTLRGRLQLALRADKTGITPLAQGFVFLGFRFDERGRRAAPEAVAHLEQRLAETTATEATSMVRGWQNYYGERERPTQTDGGTDHTSPLPTLSPEEMTRFLDLFGGREDTYARQSASGGKNRFVPCVGSPSAELVEAHLLGRETLATYLIRQDGTLRHLVLDLDRKEESGKTGKTGKGSRKGAGPDLTAVIAFAGRLMQVCRDYGVPASLEDSGRRGRHVWLFFREPVPAEAARRLGRLLAVQAGFPCAGVRVEILPRHTEWPGPELGDAVKLPFGVHPLTSRRCFFLDAEERPIPDVATALAQVRTLDATEVEAVTRALAGGGAVATASPREGGKVERSEPVRQLLEGCAVVRALVERARQTGHLRHTHQLILLYTAGHLGPEGAAFIHRTIAQCRNYDAKICQGYIDRLDPKHPPLGCRRIREWLEEEGESGLCTCPSARRTPLEAVVERQGERPEPRKPARPTPRPLPLSAEPDLWQDMAEEIFQQDEE